MEWRDTGFVLATRRHGESALIVELLTAEHGRHAGLVRGGQSPRRRALLQPGNAVAASWRGRLPEHLGSFECELVDAHAARLLDDADRLAALNAAVALLLAALPEREPHPDVHASFGALLQALSSGTGAVYPQPHPPPLAGEGASGAGGEWRASFNPPPQAGEGRVGVTGVRSRDSAAEWGQTY